VGDGGGEEITIVWKMTSMMRSSARGRRWGCWVVKGYFWVELGLLRDSWLKSGKKESRLGITRAKVAEGTLGYIPMGIDVLDMGG